MYHFHLQSNNGTINWDAIAADAAKGSNEQWKPVVAEAIDHCRALSFAPQTDRQYSTEKQAMTCIMNNSIMVSLSSINVYGPKRRPFITLRPFIK